MFHSASNLSVLWVIAEGPTRRTHVQSEFSLPAAGVLAQGPTEEKSHEKVP